MGLAVILADVVTMDLVVNAMGYVIGLGFIVFLFVVIFKSMARDRKYEGGLDGFNELYEKNKNNSPKPDQKLNQ